jgi:hypothetical protein
MIGAAPPSTDDKSPLENKNLEAISINNRALYFWFEFTIFI